MGGQIFFTQPPQKFLGGNMDGTWGRQLGTTRLNILSREKLSAPTLA